MTDEISQFELGAHDDPLARAMNGGARVEPDPRFRAELRERLTAVAVPPPAGRSPGAEVQPWLPLVALTAGAIVLGLFAAARSSPSEMAQPPAPTGTVSSGVRPVHTAVPDSLDASDRKASPPVEELVDVAPTAAAVVPPLRLAVPVIGPTEAGPIDVATLPSANASPTAEEEEEDEEEADATSQPSPSPTALLDPESPPTAVATSTPGPTSRPRPTATPVAPTPGVPGG